MVYDRAQTKRQKKLAQKGEIKNGLRSLHFELKRIEPITDNQDKVFESYKNDQHLFLHGCPGTGKTFLAMYLALQDVLKGNYNKIVIVRSAQSSKDIGFLPGDEKEKLEVYQAPYRLICNELFGRADAYEILKTKGMVEFHSTSFLRGSTIDDAILIYDEIQNSRYMEQKTVISRLGKNARLILCGDLNQDDLSSERYNEKTGLDTLMKVLHEIPSVDRIDFVEEDIVRSGFVKEFILAENKVARRK